MYALLRQDLCKPVIFSAVQYEDHELRMPEQFLCQNRDMDRF